MRARVRMRRDYICRNISPGQEKHFRAGEEYILVWWPPRESSPGYHSAGIWGTDYDIDEAWLVPADAVDLVEVLAP